MMKRIFICLILVANCSYVLWAQLAIGKSSSQTMIERAITDCLYIVEQSYQLCDTLSGEKFGRNNTKHFSTVYSIGIGIDGKLLVNDRVVNPAKYDKDFEKYQKKYIPVNVESRLRNWNDTIIADLSLQQELPSGKFLSQVSVNESNEGWLIIASSPKSESETRFYPEITIYAKRLNCETDTAISVSEWGTDNVLGGLFIVPSYKGSGEIKFLVSGYLKERINDKWLLSPLQSDEQKENGLNCSNVIKPNSNDDDLTPINNEKDRKARSKNKNKIKKK